MKIGIYGGTFDPIHIGHLLCAEWIRSQLKLDKVLFIPAKLPPHKQEQNITDAYHRCNMIELSIKDNPYFELSRIELQSIEPISYTWFTVQKIKQLYPSADLYLMLGADTIYDLPNWKYINNIFDNCKLVGFERGGELSLDHENYFYKEKMVFVDTPKITISSTQIRSRVSRGESIKYLVAEAVIEYSKENCLYECL